MSTKAFCFLLMDSYSSSFHQVFENLNFKGSGSQHTRNGIVYGTVSVRLKFSILYDFAQKNNNTIIYSNFTGQDIEAQIKGKVYYGRKM